MAHRQRQHRPVWSQSQAASPRRPALLRLRLPKALSQQETLGCRPPTIPRPRATQNQRLAPREHPHPRQRATRARPRTWTCPRTFPRTSKRQHRRRSVEPLHFLNRGNHIMEGSRRVRDSVLTALLIAPDRDLAQQFTGTLTETRAFQVLADLKSYPARNTLDIRLRQFKPD